MSCPNNGLCRNEVVWTSLLPSLAALVIGGSVLLAVLAVRVRRREAAERTR